SADPASFELHLRRRHQNALFPPARQVVTVEELSAAQERDRDEVEQVKVRFRALLQQTLDSPDFVDFSSANALRGSVDALIESALTVGGSASDLVPELRKARSTLIDAMRQTVEGNAEARAALEKA